ncbi:MAG TPA: hypothetical protein VFP55_02125 [Solirubrobacteraceae bacterium]|nr:hypothetical protein [Solirubrobacteraceae bacterium]
MRSLLLILKQKPAPFAERVNRDRRDVVAGAEVGLAEAESSPDRHLG